MKRVPDWSTESDLRQRSCFSVAGIDEAGRGCLAGPVVAAAVILPFHCTLRGINDSKRLSAAQREALEPAIKNEALAWSVASCSPAEIDRLNILHAAMEAMRRAASLLCVEPDALLIDGNRSFPRPGILTLTLVSGDARSVSIAAASVLAKTERDRQMRHLDTVYPGYGWISNKGYPTRQHFKAIRELGVTPEHRKSFTLEKPVPLQVELFDAS